MESMLKMHEYLIVCVCVCVCVCLPPTSPPSCDWVPGICWGAKFKASSHEVAMIQVGLRVPTPLAEKRPVLLRVPSPAPEALLARLIMLLSVQAYWLCLVHLPSSISQRLCTFALRTCFNPRLILQTMGLVLVAENTSQQLNCVVSDEIVQDLGEMRNTQLK